MIDVTNGFGQVPSSPVRVVAGDDFSVDCRANTHVYNTATLRWVTAGDNVTVTNRARLTVTTTQSVQPPYQYSSTICIYYYYCSRLTTRTTWVSRYEKGKTSLDLNDVRDDGVLGWHQLDHMQQSAPCSRQITLSLNFYRPDALPDAQPTVSKHWRQYIVSI